MRTVPARESWSLLSFAIGMRSSNFGSNAHSATFSTNKSGRIGRAVKNVDNNPTKFIKFLPNGKKTTVLPPKSAQSFSFTSFFDLKNLPSKSSIPTHAPMNDLTKTSTFVKTDAPYLATITSKWRHLADACRQFSLHSAASSASSMVTLRLREANKMRSEALLAANKSLAKTREMALSRGGEAATTLIGSSKKMAGEAARSLIGSSKKMAEEAATSFIDPSKKRAGEAATSLICSSKKMAGKAATSLIGSSQMMVKEAGKTAERIEANTFKRLVPGDAYQVVPASFKLSVTPPYKMNLMYSLDPLRGRQSHVESLVNGLHVLDDSVPGAPQEAKEIVDSFISSGECDSNRGITDGRLDDVATMEGSKMRQLENFSPSVVEDPTRLQRMRNYAECLVETKRTKIKMAKMMWTTKNASENNENGKNGWRLLRDNIDEVTGGASTKTMKFISSKIEVAVPRAQMMAQELLKR